MLKFPIFFFLLLTLFPVSSSKKPPTLEDILKQRWFTNVPSSSDRNLDFKSNEDYRDLAAVPRTLEELFGRRITSIALLAIIISLFNFFSVNLLINNNKKDGEYRSFLNKNKTKFDSFFTYAEYFKKFDYKKTYKPKIIIQNFYFFKKQKNFF